LYFATALLKAVWMPPISITIDSEGISVGGIHVIGKQAPSRIQIFRILLRLVCGWRQELGF
jgi:hypothetical protein